MRVYLGCDPGKKGAIAAIGPSGSVLGVCRLSETPRDVCDFVRDIICGNEGVAVLEKVGSMPGEGHMGAFTFGWSAGGLEWMLVALGVKFEKVAPSAWQRAMGCPVAEKGAAKNVHKNNLKARAQALFPTQKMTLIDCDALLLAEYARRHLA